MNSLFRKMARLHDSGGRRRLVGMAGVGQRKADHEHRQANQHQDGEQVRSPPRKVGQDFMALALFGGAGARHHEAAERFAGDSADMQTSIRIASRSVPRHVGSGRILWPWFFSAAREPATTRPQSASPAIKPAAAKMPVFSMRAFWASLKVPLSRSLSVPQRKSPP